MHELVANATPRDAKDAMLLKNDYWVRVRVGLGLRLE